MASVTGITLVKSFTYRGKSGEEWSSKYHLRDNPPSNSALWETTARGLAGLEKVLYPASCSVVRAYGYATDNPHDPAVWVGYWADDGTPIPGTYAPAANEHPFAGDQAAVLWWQLDVKDSRGKWIYCRKYMHAGFTGETTPDVLSPEYSAALQTFADELNPNKGAYFGGIRRVKDLTPVTFGGYLPDVTTRTLKRRGKRPPPPA